MMLRAVPLLLIAACMSAGRPAQQVTMNANGSDTASTGEQRPKQDSYLFTDSLHDIRFLVSTHMDMSQGATCQVDAVNMSMKGSKDIVQHLVLQHQVVPCPMPDGHFQAVEVGDFNFDHMKEFRVMRPAVDLTNPKYDYWLYDAKLNGFAASSELDSIQDPMFDWSRAMISSQWYAGPGHRGGSTYKVEGGRIVMVSNMEKFTEGDHERWVIWGMKDGKFQPVQERQVPLPKE